MRIETADMSDTERLADLWVALAHDQRTYGSYLLPEENHDTIRESVARHIVTEGLLVARVDAADDAGAGVDDAGAGVDDATGAETEVETGAETGAEEHERIVGFVMFGPETGSYEQDVAKGVIQNIYVAPEHRGTGIGADLLAAAERAMVEDGMETAVLDVMARNDRARAFYRRHGYHDHRVTMAKDDVDENDMHSKED